MYINAIFTMEVNVNMYIITYWTEQFIYNFLVTIYEFTEEKKTGPESIETDPPGLLSFQKNSLSGNYTTSRFLNDKSSSWF